jgi:hypothetical protein
VLSLLSLLIDFTDFSSSDALVGCSGEISVFALEGERGSFLFRTFFASSRDLALSEMDRESLILGSEFSLGSLTR